MIEGIRDEWVVQDRKANRKCKQANQSCCSCGHAPSPQIESLEVQDDKRSALGIETREKAKIAQA